MAIAFKFRKKEKWRGVIVQHYKNVTGDIPAGVKNTIVKEAVGDVSGSPLSTKRVRFVQGRPPMVTLAGRVPRSSTPAIHMV